VLDLPDPIQAPAPPQALFEAAASTEMGARLLAALHSRQGREITPMLAAAIVAEACCAGQPIDLRQFPAQFYGGAYMIQAERFERILRELHPLHVAHWHETEKHRAGLPFDPDYQAVIADEREGRVLQFTARDAEWRLVGNLRMYLGTSRHSGTLFATEDTLYVAPEARGGMLGLRLMRYAEKCLRVIGVREISANSKLVNKADVLMRRMGYTAVATEFTKVFED
jgi:GNAT superfamily N-acetyltransferase